MSHPTEILVLGIGTDEIATINCLLHHASNDQFVRLDFQRLCLIHNGIDIAHDLIQSFNISVTICLCNDGLAKHAQYPT